MKRSPFKIAMVVLGYLGAGAVVNVVVAWGIAIWVPLPPRGISTYQPPRMAHPRVDASWQPPIASDFKASFGIAREKVFWTGNPDPAHMRDIRKSVVEASGLPFLALSSAEVMDTSATPTFRQATVPAISVPRVLRGSRAERRVFMQYLPAAPIWRGAILNTLFFSMAVYVGKWLIGGNWRKARLRRGVCPACAYPIGVSAKCTECGHALPRVAVQAGTP